MATMSRPAAQPINAEEEFRPSLGCQPPDHPFNKQWQIFNSRARILLVSGSRLSGKTWAVLHRVVRHLWETPGARVGIFAKSKGLAKEGGSWQDLCERTIPEWVNAGLVTPTGMPFEITTKDKDGTPGPKTDGETRSAYIRVRNYYGGESEARLFSIDNDHDVASKVKNKSFSMIYFIELSMFKDRRILSTTLLQLRMPHLKPKKGEPDIYHQWIADTNPDEDLGDQSWFYDEFYRKRMATRDPKDRLGQYYDWMEVVEMFTNDNPYATEQERIILEGSCEGDPALFDSYVLGIHGQAGRKRDRWFAPWFSKNAHVIGGGEGEGDQIDVQKSSVVAYGGWDIGSSVNHAAVLLDRWYVQVDTGLKDSNGQPIFREVSYWGVLDEVVSINERIGLGELTQEVMRKMQAIERAHGGALHWIHWSDDSALNVWRASSSTYDYLEVMAASNDQITLQGAEKPDGSVRSRVQILQRLLKENRIFISARCEKVIAMLEGCQKGEKDKEYVRWDEHKHVFDALTYPLFMESREELFDLASKRPRATAANSGLIGVG